jgi:drug/metabolite transporter (DMT)-like permease
MQKKTGPLIVALAADCWSGSGVLGKFATWSPLAITGARAILAVLLMALVRGGFRVRFSRGNVLGALGVSVTSVLFMAANKLTTAANAIVLQYAMPVFVILLVWIIYGQRPVQRDVFTTIFVLGGVFLCSVDSFGGGNLLGDALALLSGFTYSFVFLCARMKDTDAREYTFLGLIFCAPLALFAYNDPGATFTLPNVLALLGLGLCLSSGYLLIAVGMRHTSPMTAAIAANIEPVLNPLWVFLFLGEKPGPLALVGSIVVLATVTIYSVTARTAKKPDVA